MDASPCPRWFATWRSITPRSPWSHRKSPFPLQVGGSGPRLAGRRQSPASFLSVKSALSMFRCETQGTATTTGHRCDPPIIQAGWFLQGLEELTGDAELIRTVIGRVKEETGVPPAFAWSQDADPLNPFSVIQTSSIAPNRNAVVSPNKSHPLSASSAPMRCQ